MKNMINKIKEHFMDDLAKNIICLIVIAISTFLMFFAIKEYKESSFIPEGYEKVLIQEKNGTLCLDGLVESEKIDILLSKNSSVKVYHDTNLSSYLYLTEDDLKDMLITVGKHSYDE